MSDVMLVTGGAGFIGTNFIRYIMSSDPYKEIVCVDSLTYAGNPDNLTELTGKAGFRFYHNDISDRTAMYRIFEEVKPDTVVNFAAESHVDRSLKDPELFIRTNVIGTEILMDACLKYNVGRFHQVSTDEVYGDLPLDRPELSFTEDSKIKPSSPYSASKASADLLVMAYHRSFGLPATISRCSNNYGEYQFPEKLIPYMFERCKNNESLPIFGNGKNVRDWLYVYDHCSAIRTILEKGIPGEIYNIGGHCEINNTDIVRLICDYCNKPYDLITYVADRPGHDLRYSIDASKLRSLGWTPETDFASGIEKTLDWYNKNSEWLDRIKSGEYRRG